jgi:hypothetical protein
VHALRVWYVHSLRLCKSDRIRASIVTLLGPVLHPSRPEVVKHVNEMVQVASAGYANKSADVREETFTAWFA